MDKWKNKSNAHIFGEDSLLPATLKVANVNPPPLLDKRRSKKWSIDGFFKKVTSILDIHSSSSSLEDWSKPQRRKGKSKGATSAKHGCALGSAEGIDYSPSGIYRTTTGSDLQNANDMSQTLELLDARLSNSHSRSSDGSLDGKRARCKDRVKARAEAKRDQLCVGDSSMDESSEAEELGQRGASRQHGDAGVAKGRSRASRTERYLKRICNGGGKVNGISSQKAAADSRNLEGRGCRAEEFRPIERVSANEFAQGGTGDDIYNCLHIENNVANENYYTRQTDIGVNPLVQQTLQYFSEFDRSMAAAAQQKSRKTYPGHYQHHHRRKTAHNNEVNFLQSQHQPNIIIPPKPPSRDHRSRILFNGSSLDKYQQMLRQVQKPSEIQQLNKENGYYPQARSSLYSPSLEVRNKNEDRINHSVSPSSTMHNYHLPLSPPKSPLRESLNTTRTGFSGSYESNKSPSLDINKTKCADQQLACFSTILQNEDHKNSNYMPLKTTETDKSNESRSSKNLEEALCELEAIYNSLQLGDEELLERAEKRTMEEFQYKGFMVSPDGFDDENSSSRRKTWGDANLINFKDEPEVADRLKDDMAYRRMHPKERPSSEDCQSALSRISYLMTSPAPSRRDTIFMDPKRKPRRKEPDVTLDDVVFRSMHYANNTLKVVEPQPPFGIPLGPITTATDSDYLHTSRTKPERARSPYMPSCEPDLVTDDLAFRNLRKDAQPSSGSRQPSPSLVSGGTTSPLPFGMKKKRAVRSLSANLYGLINKPGASSVRSTVGLDNDDLVSINTNSTFEDFFDEVPIKHINRRTSDPELTTSSWQNNTWDKFDVKTSNELQRQRIVQQHQRLTRENSSDLDLSILSYDESSDEKLRPQERLVFDNQATESKVDSEKGSSYISSNCSTPPPIIVRQDEPVTEQEISIYKKLCQDLENLVQMTKSVDNASASNKLISDPSQIALITEKEIANITKSEINVSSSSNNNEYSIHEQNMCKFNNNNKISDCANGNIIGDDDLDTSPLKREISTILDNLKSLGENSNCSHSSCPEEREEIMQEVVADDKSFKEITKEICDLATGNDNNKDEESKLAMEELEERKDKVDDVFFRKVQLAKRSGDWKESTPNNVINNRRTSLASNDNNHWEGEIRSCERVSMVCNASHDMSRLTAKYICYITNHITAQFCLLLVFFLVLLLAIVTVP